MIDWRAVLAVLAGGGVGAVCRYVIGAFMLQRLGPGFPYGTLAINLCGCLLIGIITELAVTRAVGLAPVVRVFLVAGVLGGFTTFSTFAYDTVMLAEDGAAIPGIIYVLASVGGGILAAYAGMILVRR